MRRRSSAVPPPIADVTSGGAANTNADRVSLTKAAAQLSIAQIIVLAGGFLTGPLLARALGPAGRGQLAAIIVPVTLLGWLAALGLGSWVTVEAARGRALGAILGTTGLLSVGLGLLAAAGGIPLAFALSDGNGTVLAFLLLGAALMPLTLCIQLLSYTAIGRSRWNMQARSRSIPAVLGVVLTSVLFASGTLTLTTAAGLFFVGSLLSALPLLPLIGEARPFRFERGLAREAAGFGFRAWTSSLGALTNARLDQLLMIPLVPDRQLGLYTVAVAYSTLPTVLSGTLMTIIAPRIAAGDNALVGRSLRVTIGLMSVGGLGLALLAPVVIPLAFGGGFGASVQMAWILLLAGVPLAGSLVLTAAMTSAGRPGTPALGQLVAAAITVVGLLVLLPSMQAVGAALVSLLAYSVALVFLLVTTARHLQVRVASLLRPERSDLLWAQTLLRSLRTRFLPRTSRSAS